MTAPNQVPPGVDAPAPQEQAVAEPPASTSAMVGEAIAPEAFIPPATRDNYAQIARDQAAVQGREPRELMQDMATEFESLHQRQPLDGYDHLAAWARSFDPGAATGPTGLAILQARVIESARRDPYQAVIGDQAAVEQGVTAQRAYDESVAGALAAPSVDPASGFLPNAGPLTIPPEVTVGAPGAEVPQGAPSAGVETPDSGPDAPDPQTGAVSPSPAPEPTSGSGKGHGKGSGSGDSSS